jgi:hypothetical protein
MSPRLLATMAAAIALTAGLTACSGAALDAARSGSVHTRSEHQAGAANAAAPLAAKAATAAAKTVPAAARQVVCPVTASPLPARNVGDWRTERVPAGFAAVAAVECVRVPVAGPIDSITAEEKRQVAVNGLAALVSALRLPSAPARGLLPACLVTDAGLPSLALIGRDGQVIYATVPKGACGMPIEQVQASLNSMRWIVLGITPASPVIPQTGVSPGVPSPGLTGRPPLQGGPIHRLTPGG